MHVVERVEAVLGGLRLVGRGQLLVAIPRVDPAQAQAPEQCGGIEHLQLDLRSLGPQRAVVNLQHPVEAIVVEIEERDVPPVVEGEAVVVLRPIGLAPFHEGDAFLLPRLHLHDVADRVLRPAVVRLQVDGLPAGVLRRAVVPAFLQAEGGHAEQEAVSGVVLV